MDVTTRIERALEQALVSGGQAGCPPGLARAVHYSVFPGGARVRPRLCLAVAAACGDPDPALSDAAAVAIELLHCASLVHDDLPCFDDAPMRRGKPSVHSAFGERLAVLTGDALIVHAFEVLARGALRRPERLPALIATVAAATGMPTGIVAGQAWECETQVDLADYQRAKTGSLFAAATVAGAQAAGQDGASWRWLGEHLGEAYQVADDIQDATAAAELLGKPTGRDRALGRPSAVAEHGLAGAVARVKTLVADAIAAVPDCSGSGALRSLILAESRRILPGQVARLAA
jgi:geranylgeranyl diphosphate synthase type II